MSLANPLTEYVSAGELHCKRILVVPAHLQRHERERRWSPKSWPLSVSMAAHTVPP